MHQPSRPSSNERARPPLTKADFQAMYWPATSEEGLLAVCRLSDDVRAFALAGCKIRNPEAGPEELDRLLNEFFDSWERLQPRVRFDPPR